MTPPRLSPILSFIPVLLAASVALAESPPSSPAYLQALEALRAPFSEKQELPPLRLPAELIPKEREDIQQLSEDARAAQKREPKETSDAYAQRVYDVARRLNWPVKDAYKVYLAEHNSGALGVAVGFQKKDKKTGPKAKPDDPALRGKNAVQIAKGIAAGLKSNRQTETLPGGSAEIEGPAFGHAHEDGIGKIIKEQNALPQAQGRPDLKIHEPDLHIHPALSNEDIAPEAGILDRIGSAFYSDDATVAEDLRSAKRIAAAMKLPNNYRGHNMLANSPPAAFLQWVQTVKEKDLPNIGYGILPKERIGQYEPGMLSNGDITINYFIRGAEPEARGAVTLHELYHFWDKKVAKNHYTNVSYGMVDPANMWRHEVDSTFLTALAAEQSLPEKCLSALCEALKKIPTDDLNDVIEYVRERY